MESIKANLIFAYALEKGIDYKKAQDHFTYGALYARERRLTLKENGICPKCGKNNAIKGKVHCFDCLKKRRDGYKTTSAKKDPDDAKIKRKIYRYNKYHKSKENGLCPECGHKKESSDYVLCDRCRGKRKSVYMELKQKGICVFCRKNKALEGYVTCHDCRLYINQYYSGYFEHRHGYRVGKSK